MPLCGPSSFKRAIQARALHGAHKQNEWWIIISNSLPLNRRPFGFKVQDV